MIDSMLGRPMAVSKRLSGLGLMVELSDEIDLAARDELRHALLPLVDAPIAILDLTNVTYCDTTLLNAVIRLVGERRSAGNDLPLRIAGAGPRVRRLFALTEIDRLVCIYGSMRNSLAASRSSSGHRRAGEGDLGLITA